MGIDIDSSVIVGERVGDILSLEGVEDICEWADNNNLSYCSPYYDCDRDDYIIGFPISAVDISSDDISDKIRKHKLEFKEITRSSSRVIITNDVW